MAALVCLAGAPAADAATAYISTEGTEQVLHYDAASGEGNQVSLSGPNEQLNYALSDAPQEITITPGPGCTALFSHEVRCSSVGLDRIEISAGDGDDQVRIFTSDLPVVAEGGEGKDTLDDNEIGAGTPAHKLDGGPGDDAMRATSISAPASARPDEYVGGSGEDAVTYGWRSQTQAISLDDVANDGLPGEADNVHSDIESVIGGSAADTIVGTSGNDTLAGLGGADRIEGLDGDDKLDPSFGCDPDELIGGDGADELLLGGNSSVNGGPGDDRLVTDHGFCPDTSDEVFGGTGTDTADFSGIHESLSVSLDNIADDGWGSDNFHSDIENLIASDAGMVMIAGPGPNVLTGGPGDDLLAGGADTDRIVGGGGVDVADYSDHTTAVDVSLNGVDDDGSPGENDELTGIEDMRGGDGSDALVGDDADNVIDGGLGGDLISGGAGLDAVDYSERENSVSADLDGAAGDDGEAGEHDTVASDIEGVFGGLGGDTLVGNGADGFLLGWDGNDRLTDAGGADLLDAGEGADFIDSRDGVADSDVCGAGVDGVLADAIDELEDCEGPPGPGSPPATVTPRPPATRKPRSPRPILSPTDRLAPAASVRASPRRRLSTFLAKGLRVSVACTEPCAVTATVTAPTGATGRMLKRRGLSRRTVLARAGSRRPASRRTLTVRSTRIGRRVLRRQREVRITLVVKVTDRAGNTRRITRRLRLGS